MQNFYLLLTLESPEEKSATGSVVRLPGIREDTTPGTPIHQKEAERSEVVLPGISLIGAPAVKPDKTSSLMVPSEEKPNFVINLQAPFPPRIDVSRASSSSHHGDSRESTPERELFEGIDQKGAKLGIAFKEEGTLDLRSSTEELDFQDPTEKIRTHCRPHSPLAANDSLQSHQRKDSQSSEVGLLSISGRTSRLSSIGSQGSAQSRISNTSHLSVISGTSGRSCSPHKMLLETSFCGTKSPEIIDSIADKPENSDVLEKVLLSRKHDPREVILAEGIKIERKREPSPGKAKGAEGKGQSKPNVEITVKIDKPEATENKNAPVKPKLPKKIISASGVEYIYIPLKGPLPEDDKPEITVNPKPREIILATSASKPTQQVKGKDAGKKSKSATASPSMQRSKAASKPIQSQTAQQEEPKYIRIKLKPDHMYDEGPQNISQVQVEPEPKKPACLDLNEANNKPNVTLSAPIKREAKAELISCTVRTTESQGKGLLNSTPLSSPNLIRHTNLGSKSPSPSLSRKSSFTSLFKSRETVLSPDSPTGTSVRRKSTGKMGIFKDSPDTTRDRRRSRSKSRDREKPSSTSTAPSSTESIDTKSKQKSVLSLFKPKKSSTKSKSDSPEIPSKTENKINDSYFAKSYYSESPLQGESIRIPLHSPTDSDQKTVVDEGSIGDESIKVESEESTKSEGKQDEQSHTEKLPSVEPERSVSKIEDKRQNSTSSENVVFSTMIGSNEQIFSTKLPKENFAKSIFKEAKSKSTQNSLEDAAVKTEAPEKQIEKKVDLHQVQEEKHAKIDTKTNLKENKPEKQNNSVNGELSAKEKEKLNFQIKEVVTASTKEEARATSTVAESSEKVAVSDLIDSPSRLSLDKNSEETFNQPETTKTVKTVITNNRVSMISTEEDIYSSESEKDSEVDYLRTKRELEEKLESLEPERRGLVFQQDSFEDELPYTPTTLPLERSVAVPIVPIKERGNIDVKTCPIDRPRSTTPINLTCLETYREEMFGSSQGQSVHDIEKIKISLPKEITLSNRPKSPRKPGTTKLSEFTQRLQSIPKEGVPTSTGTIPKESLKEWINFEDIPEKRKPPRRIQTIPSKNVVEVSDSALQENIVYSYVNPEDCKCECHESTREREKKSKQEEATKVQEDEIPLLEDEPAEEEKSLQEPHEKLKQEIAISDRRSVISDSSVDISTSLEPADASCAEQSLRTPFTGDLGVSSNRSSIISQEEVHIPENATSSPRRALP